MKKIFVILTISLLILSGCATPGPSGSNDSYKQITAEEAMELMKSETDYIILDVRTQEEFDQGHIPGAICIPNETISDEPPAQLPDKDQLILVYCRSGNRSKQASDKLVSLGYTNIHEFGVIIDWPGETVK
ncbi:MAG: rhodanese-like domain-containing protein [Firmicutes bacterium]|nr:rhodanese-like domain-containing protein [Bacillota bacterium]